ncbi:MAG: hypothetical protein JSV30_04550 [Candidatus Omnitrophota bacterium]|nr:MAG: hypothetical protein JSV30_04550 [Candidatus Omnitrophota bacterium]
MNIKEKRGIALISVSIIAIFIFSIFRGVKTFSNIEDYIDSYMYMKASKFKLILATIVEACALFILLFRDKFSEKMAAKSKKYSIGYYKLAITLMLSYVLLISIIHKSFILYLLMGY